MRKNIILTTIVLILCLITSASSQTTTQNNTSGSNTSITGGYTSSSSSTYESGSASNSTTTTNSTTNSYSGDTRVAATASAFSQDLCVVGYSGGVSTFGLGISGGSYTRDENCERIKLSKVLNDLGMKVASVSILCQDPRVFHAMENSGTPCPFEGKIGADATAQWLKYDKLRPDYNLYIEKLKVIEETKKQESLTEKK